MSSTRTTLSAKSLTDDEPFAVSWSQPHVDEANALVRLNVSKARLERAPGFNESSWPDLFTPGTRSAIDRYDRS